MIADNQINVTDAAQHYSQAHRRGVQAGRIDERQKLLELLQAEHDNGPYSVEVKVGLQIALSKVKNFK